MNHLGVPKGRRRGLSVNSVSDAQQRARNTALNSLQDDLSHVESQWNRILTENSNPLELALAFLDDTSVGLGHRYEDFRQLKTRIGYDLKEAVNEHFQVLNTTVASYSIAVESITNAQDNIVQLKTQIADANKNITMEKGNLRVLNEKSKVQSEMVEILSAIEYLMQLPEKVEDHIRNSDYKDAQKLLARGFLSANTHNLWSLETLQILKQQLEMQEHVLFNTLIEEIHTIVYSKAGLKSSEGTMLEDIGQSWEGFTSLENYIYNVVNVDVSKQSRIMSNRLTKFLDILKAPGYKETTSIPKDDDFGRIFFLLSILHDINQLPNALSILTDRAKEEFHNIIIKCTEEIRMNHPSMLKMALNLTEDSNFGISAKDALSVVIRKCFFRIFVKLLIAAQGHRIVFETVSTLLPSTDASKIYRFDLVWPKLLDEIETLISRYLKNSVLSNDVDVRYGNTSISTSSKKKHSPLFVLQNNIKDSSAAVDHTNELKALLKDIFPGINISTNAELESIYVEEESFEQEESLIAPSVFNMKVLLEPLLIFCQSASDLIPLEFSTRTQSSMNFFVDYMDQSFLPELKMTLSHLFASKIEATNPYTLELTEENKYICKPAADFKNLLYKLLYVMNTTHIFRKKICSLLLDFLDKFHNYYLNLFKTLFGTNHSISGKKIITIWLEDKKIMEMENQILNEDFSVALKEARALISHCPDFFREENSLQKDDLLNIVTVDAVELFLSTSFWILEWLPSLKKLVTPSLEPNGVYDADHLKDTWSFFESSDLTNMDKMAAPKISMDVDSSEKFDEIVVGFSSLKNRLLSAIRFDIRARCLYHIGSLFQNTRSWNADVDSAELDEHISSLLHDLKMLENKYRQQFPPPILDAVFTGIDKLNNLALLGGMHSIRVLNKNGIKKILKNVSVLQHTCRNILSDPSNVDMSDAMNLYSLCGSDESTFFKQIEAGNLFLCSKDDLKVILRLQFSEELQKQLKRSSDSSKRVNSLPLNSKKYHDAVKKLETLQLQ
ncbi:hypothetical protein HG535_0A02430 [Zygotorulaspora mrakii]|uniref:Exocyst complex component Sec8 n=1 Tax=Zygotorulaspora mrakii TaxID=42260 RepID=A0A7H9AVJ6_ZYGMR|nr:uncharacterized protein HG535_0A02430 [Zygotorulaspora mrakii]QLG70305.1 hypothetical protein HG535_0A02430 [Zygotorulaspora mrakii]